MGSWPSRLDTIGLDSKSALTRSIAAKAEEGTHTFRGQIDGIGIESGVALRGGKAQDEGGEEDGKGQHVDLVALF